MSRTRTIAVHYLVSEEALRLAAFDLDGEARAHIDAGLSLPEYRGPRGGRYVPSGPIRVAVSTGSDLGSRAYVGKRTVRYARPAR